MSKLIETNQSTPSLALIQVMKFHQRIRKAEEISTDTILFNLMLCSRFYIHTKDVGRLLVTLVDLSDHLFYTNHHQEASEVLKVVFITLNKLDPKPWIRELIATILLIVVSAIIPFENVKKANLVFEPKGFGANAGER